MGYLEVDVVHKLVMRTPYRPSEFAKCLENTSRVCTCVNYVCEMAKEKQNTGHISSLLHSCILTNHTLTFKKHCGVNILTTIYVKYSS